MKVLRLTFCLVVWMAGWVQPVRAAPMELPPKSGDFAYGARLDPQAEDAVFAMNVAASLGLDWIAIDFDWAKLWPAAVEPLAWDYLDALMYQAQSTSRQVMISISNAPDWAMTVQGPNTELTAWLVTRLAAAYPGVLGAVELFPSANTRAGWGALPDPGAYTRLLEAVGSTLQAGFPTVVVVAGGLQPLEADHPDTDFQDLSFLEQLYAYGATPWMPVLSLRLDHLTGDPLQVSTPQEPRVLRRYEDIRQSMIAHQHTSGQIWISGYAWPKPGNTQAGDDPANPSAPIDQAAQTRWLSQAIQQMRSQLYIGVAFFTQLSQTRLADSPPGLCQDLLLLGGSELLHPAALQLARLISLDRSGYYPFPVEQPPAKSMPKNFDKVQNT